MGDAVLIAILLAAFFLAIGLVRVVGRLIDSGDQDSWADEPPDTDGAGPDGPAADAAGRGRSR